MNSRSKPDLVDNLVRQFKYTCKKTRKYRSIYRIDILPRMPRWATISCPMVYTGEGLCTETGSHDTYFPVNEFILD